MSTEAATKTATAAVSVKGWRMAGKKINSGRNFLLQKIFHGRKVDGKRYV